MERLFSIFDATKTTPRETHAWCKIQPFERFRDEPHWVVERWWSPEEKRRWTMMVNWRPTKRELDAVFGDLQSAIEEYDHLVEPSDDSAGELVSVVLGDEALFETFIGKRVLKKQGRTVGSCSCLQC